MAMQAVDVFAPGWISNPVSIPKSSSTSYAGRLVQQFEGSTNNNAQTAQQRDQQLLKKTSLKCARTAATKAHPYCKDLIKEETAVCTAVECGANNRLSNWDVVSCHDDHDEIHPRREIMSSCEAFQPTWTRQGEPPDCDNGQEPRDDGSKIETSEEKKGQKSKAVKAWKRQLNGLKDKDVDTSETFVPTWMKKTAPSSHDENDREKHAPRVLCATGASNVARTTDASAFNRRSNMLDTVLSDEESQHRLPKSYTEVQDMGRSNIYTEAKTLKIDAQCKKANTCALGSCPSNGIHSGKEISSLDEMTEQQDERLQSDFHGHFRVHVTGDALSKSFSDCANMSSESQLNRLILQVLLTAAVSVFVRDIIEESLIELEDEMLMASAFETLANLDLSNQPSDDGNSLQSDSLSDGCQDQSWLGYDVEWSPAGSTGSVEDLISNETPPWDLVEAVLGEEQLIHACLQNDAQEHGYAASVAVMDGGKEDGLMADMILLCTPEGDSFTVSGDSSLSPTTGLDDGVLINDNDCGDRERTDDKDVEL
ncbi:uncharacterized protein LOC110976162 isoform X2 [Acanthaster planci]|uniref:Uncharacterized protein LOC110976162 isoform X2 n=1 Tax=Acanthaster planci TaxID=133434 RepID=A0A8B7XYR1_ACAPL|nr:uncharacterized protein LOC110976162 isoform X2 [Acanthaster planci]